METALAVARDGGVVSRVGAPQYPVIPAGFPEFLRNLTVTGRVFDRTVSLDDVPAGYRAMVGRAVLKVLIRPVG